MYSLGIVAFEVAHAPWDTAMERVEHIQALRRAGDRPAAAASAPGVFAADADATVAALVVALVRQDPGERPGAAALLEGPLLPARAELERPLLERATAALRNPLSETRGVLVDALFDAPTPEVVDLGFDASDDDGAKPAARRRRAAARDHDFGVAPARRRLAAAKVERAVVALLERHGCVPFDAPLLRPRPPPRGDGGGGDGGVPLLDARGAVLLLPDESTSGFARRVARRALARPHFGACRRYAAGRVFAARSGAARPRERREIAFDVVATAAGREPSGAALCGEALALAAAAAALGEGPGAVAVALGHGALAGAIRALKSDASPPRFREQLDALFDGTVLAGPPRAGLRRAAALLAAARAAPAADDRARKRWEAARRDAALAVGDLDAVLACAAYAGLDEGDDEIDDGGAPAARSLSTSPGRGTPSSWTAEARLEDRARPEEALHRAARRLRRRGPGARVAVDAALPFARPFAGGARFAVSRGGNVVAVGGRYDDAVARHASPLDRGAADAAAVAVGCRVDVDALARAAAAAADAAPAAPLEVFVAVEAAPSDESAARSALVVCAFLRRGGVAADYAPLPAEPGAGGKRRDPRRADPRASCAAWAVPWLATVGRDGALALAHATRPALNRDDLSLDELLEAVVRGRAPEARARAPRPDDDAAPRRGDGGGGLLAQALRSRRDPSPAPSAAAEAPGAPAAERLAVGYAHCASPSAPRAADARRRAAAALEAAGLRRVHLVAWDDAAPALACVSVDAKLRSLRAVGAAAIDLGADAAALRARCDDHGNDRRALRLFVDALLEARAAKRRGGALMVYVYSTHDDALDLLSLPLPAPAAHSKKPNEKAGRKGRKR